MKNKTISGDKAFDAIIGRSIARVENSRNSVEIHFTDGSFINIETTSDYNGCNVDHGDNYCYCSAPEISIDPYFHEA